MDFDKRLEQAIQRGHRIRDAHGQAAAEKTLSEEELRRLHSASRLNLTEYIDSALHKLSDRFPGFRFETIVEDTGWGARLSRDDLSFSRSPSTVGGKHRESQFSRFQVLVKPFSLQTKIVELAAKGTIRNREVVNRTYFQFITELNEAGLRDVIDNWVLEYAELFAAQS